MGRVGRVCGATWNRLTTMWKKGRACHTHTHTHVYILVLSWVLVAYRFWLLMRPWALKFSIIVASRKRRIWYSQNPGTGFCNCIIFHNCLELDYLSNSITHDYFLLWPYKLDKALISIRSDIGNSLSFQALTSCLKRILTYLKIPGPALFV